MKKGRLKLYFGETIFLSTKTKRYQGLTAFARAQLFGGANLKSCLYLYGEKEEVMALRELFCYFVVTNYPVPRLCHAQCYWQGLDEPHISHFLVYCLMKFMNTSRIIKFNLIELH